MPRLVVPILCLRFEHFPLVVELAVIRQHEMGGLAEGQVRLHRDTELAQPLNFLTRLTGSTTTPLPITHFLPRCRMPEGMR